MILLLVRDLRPVSFLHNTALHPCNFPLQILACPPLKFLDDPFVVLPCGIISFFYGNVRLIDGQNMVCHMVNKRLIMRYKNESPFPSQIISQLLFSMDIQMVGGLVKRNERILF